MSFSAQTRAELGPLPSARKRASPGMTIILLLVAYTRLRAPTGTRPMGNELLTQPTIAAAKAVFRESCG
jgi:hypothetical protein